jgi:hypothetical protein
MIINFNYIIVIPTMIPTFLIRINLLRCRLHLIHGIPLTDGRRFHVHVILTLLWFGSRKDFIVVATLQMDGHRTPWSIPTAIAFGEEET